MQGLLKLESINYKGILQHEIVLLFALYPLYINMYWISILDLFGNQQLTIIADCVSDDQIVLASLTSRLY